MNERFMRDFFGMRQRDELTLRDRFAMAALPAFLGTHGNHWTGGRESAEMWSVLAERSYDAADAMLAARKKS